MAKSLVIVESPTKAKTIGKYLGKQFIVKASLGHVKDLPKKDLAVDVEHDFTPHYEIIEGKKKLIAELKQAAKQVESVYLAADPDREGEAICWHLQEELDGRSSKKDGAPRIFRVMFNEITANAVRKAFEKPTAVNVNLVEAQQARRILDRLVGYKISPLLWDKVRRGLSAGRVQTVALRLIVEREREIRAFQKREYWTIDVNLSAKKPPVLTAHFAKRNDETIDIGDEQAAKNILDQLEGAKYIVQSVTTREKRRNPVAPFITSTLQQEASRKLRFSVKRTMGLAQRLYEGVELGGEGATGLITYMRTDSTRVSQEAIAEVRELVAQRYGQDFVPESPNAYQQQEGYPGRARGHPSQLGHADAGRDCEIPAGRRAEAVSADLDALRGFPDDAGRFRSDHHRRSRHGRDGAKYLFRATGSVPKFKGFLEVYEEGKDQKDEEDEE